MRNAEEARELLESVDYRGSAPWYYSLSGRGVTLSAIDRMGVKVKTHVLFPLSLPALRGFFHTVESRWINEWTLTSPVPEDTTIDLHSFTIVKRIPDVRDPLYSVVVIFAPSLPPKCNVLVVLKEALKILEVHEADERLFVHGVQPFDPHRQNI